MTIHVREPDKMLEEKDIRLTLLAYNFIVTDNEAMEANARG